MVEPREKLRAARLQNETAPEQILNQYEKWLEKREKGSEKRSETCPKIVPPRHKTNTCRKKVWGNYFSLEYMRGLYSHSREHRTCFTGNIHFPQNSQILVNEGIQFGGNTCLFLYSHPHEYRKRLLANYLCIGFVPG